MQLMFNGCIISSRSGSSVSVWWTRFVAVNKTKITTHVDVSQNRNGERRINTLKCKYRSLDRSIEEWGNMYVDTVVAKQQSVYMERERLRYR